MYALEVIIAMNDRRPAPRQCETCGQRVEAQTAPPPPVKPPPIVQAPHQAPVQTRN
jgi:hypothetical protein